MPWPWRSRGPRCAPRPPPARRPADRRPMQERTQEIDGAVQPLMQRLRGHRRHPGHAGPGRRVLQALAARSVRQGQPQQCRPVGDAIATAAADRPGSAGQFIRFDVGGKPGRGLGPGVPNRRCCAWHLRDESYRIASCLEVFPPAGAYPDAYVVKPGQNDFGVPAKTGRPRIRAMGRRTENRPSHDPVRCVRSAACYNPAPSRRAVRRALRPCRGRP